MTIGTPVLVGSVATTANNATQALTTTQDSPAGGSMLVLFGSSAAAQTLTSAADSAVNTYTNGKTFSTSGGHLRAAEAYAQNIIDLPNAGTVTATILTGNTQRELVAIYIPNTAATSLDVDGAIARGNTVTTISLATGTLAQADEAVIGWVAVQSPGQSDTFTEASGWTTLATVGVAAGIVLHVAYILPGSTAGATYNPTLGTAREAVWNVITFMGAAASAPFTPANLPNPRPAAASDRSFSAPLALALVAAISAAPPFVPGDFPNPQVRTRLTPPAVETAQPILLTAGFSATTVLRGPLVTRIVGPDRRVAIGAQDWTVSAMAWLRSVPAPPFFQADWPLPGRPIDRRDLANFTGPTALNLLGLDTFFGPPGVGPAYDYPNPRVVSRLVPHVGDGQRAAFYTTPAPFLQRDWPNPLGYRQPLANKTHLGPMALNLRGQDNFFSGPGAGPDYDWPNPTRPRPAAISLGTHVEPSKLNLLGQDKLFDAAGEAQARDFPNPLIRGRLLPDVGHYDPTRFRPAPPAPVWTPVAPGTTAWSGISASAAAWSPLSPTDPGWTVIPPPSPYLS